MTVRSEPRTRLQGSSTINSQSHATLPPDYVCNVESGDSAGFDLLCQLVHRQLLCGGPCHGLRRRNGGAPTLPLLLPERRLTFHLFPHIVRHCLFVKCPHATALGNVEEARGNGALLAQTQLAVLNLELSIDVQSAAHQ